MKRRWFVVGIVVILLLAAGIWYVAGRQKNGVQTDNLAEAGQEAVSGSEAGTETDMETDTGVSENGSSAEGASAGASAVSSGTVQGDGENGNMTAGSGADIANTGGTSSESGSAAVEPELPKEETISWDDSWEFSDYSIIHTDDVILHRADAAVRKDIVVAVNAGHGCAGGSSEQTQCHPDGTPKVTGGSTGAGAVTATAINEGCTLQDGTREADAVLSLARLTKDALLEAGYDVLMIRDNEDTQLDNIARTVFANNCADCHLSLHYDSTDSDKGFFYISVPDNASYRSMEPVASHWEEHNALGEAILQGMTEQETVKISGDGSIALDLTQTSYSTVPSVDVEVGDKASDHSEEAQKVLAAGIVAGVGHYFDGSADMNASDSAGMSTNASDSAGTGTNASDSAGTGM